MSWDNYTYKKPQYDENKPGIYRCIIMGAEIATSKSSGKRMLVISVRPSGTRATVKSYIVDNEYFDDNFSQFLDAFPVLKENNNPDTCFSWRGAEGAVNLAVDENGYFVAKRFIAADSKKLENLPDFVWKARDDEPQEKPEYQGLTEIGSDDDDDGDIPF